MAGEDRPALQHGTRARGCFLGLGACRLRKFVNKTMSMASAVRSKATQLQSTISSFVAAEFDLGIEASVADAARVVTLPGDPNGRSRSREPAAKKRLAFAQNEASRGDDALAEGDVDEALERYRGASPARSGDREFRVALTLLGLQEYTAVISQKHVREQPAN